MVIYGLGYWKSVIKSDRDKLTATLQPASFYAAHKLSYPPLLMLAQFYSYLAAPKNRLLTTVPGFVYTWPASFNVCSCAVQKHKATRDTEFYCSTSSGLERKISVVDLTKRRFPLCSVTTPRVAYYTWFCSDRRST